MRQLDHLQQLGDFCLDAGSIRSFTTRQYRQAEGDIVEHRHMAKQRVVLEHEADFTVTRMHAADVGTVKTDMAAGLIFQPGDDTQQRGFPGA